jgi:uncharacterized protein (DUF58 family)
LKNLIDIQEFQQFNNLEIVAKHVVEGFITGLHKSPFHGFSVEFAEHRIYNKGESIKHIDWKLFGKTEKLYIKKYEEETNLRSYIIIDNSSSMLFPYEDKKINNKLFFSVYCAASLIYLLRKQRDATGLILFSDAIELFTSTKISSLHVKMLYSELEKLLNPDLNKLDKKTDIAKALHQIADKTHKRSLIIIFSDMISSSDYSEIFSALQHLRFKNHEVILFNVTDKKREGHFEFLNRPYKFIDMETGEKLKLNPNFIKEEYIKAVNDQLRNIKLKCNQFNIDFVDADINDDFSQVLLSYLIKRKKLY